MKRAADGMLLLTEHYNIITIKTSSDILYRMDKWNYRQCTNRQFLPASYSWVGIISFRYNGIIDFRKEEHLTALTAELLRYMLATLEQCRRISV